MTSAAASFGVVVIAISAVTVAPAKYMTAFFIWLPELAFPARTQQLSRESDAGALAMSFLYL